MIYFVRHGESTANQDKVFAGQRADVELTPKGNEQAVNVGRKLYKKGLQIDRIISSPLKRTSKTAELLAGEIDFPLEKIEYDQRITEYDLGAKTGAPVHKATPEELISAEGAEIPEKFQERIVSALNEYSKNEGNVLLVSHGGVSRMIQCYQKNLNPKDFYEQDKFDNGSIIEVNWL